MARPVWAVMWRNAIWRPEAARSSSRPHQPGAVLTAVKTMPPSAVAFGQS
jgi:hypothetical protein